MIIRGITKEEIIIEKHVEIGVEELGINLDNKECQEILHIKK